MKVIIRAGRIIKSVGSGLHSKSPVDYYHSVSTLTKEKRFSLVITKETVPIQIEGVVAYCVKDPAIYVKNYELGQKHLHKHPKTENQKLIQQLESRFKGSLTSIVGPIEIEAFNKLKEAFGSNTAERIRKILALEHAFKDARPTMFLKEDFGPNGKNRINNLFE